MKPEAQKGLERTLGRIQSLERMRAGCSDEQKPWADSGIIVAKSCLPLAEALAEIANGHHFHVSGWFSKVCPGCIAERALEQIGKEE